MTFANRIKIVWDENTNRLLCGRDGIAVNWINLIVAEKHSNKSINNQQSATKRQQRQQQQQQQPTIKQLNKQQSSNHNKRLIVRVGGKCVRLCVAFVI